MRYIAIPTLLLAILLAACAGFRPEKEATVLAIPPENAQPKQEETYTLKRKVAIGRFTNDSRLATSFLNEGSDTAERLSRAANDILSAKLAATNRFLLIERADLQALENEQDYAQITSHKIPADYLILGSISEFGRNTTGNVGLVDRSKKQTAHAKVTLRIVDTRTGQEVLAIFQRLNREGKTILMVTHEYDVGQHCKRVVRFKDGHIIADEPVENPLDALEELARLPRYRDEDEEDEL